MYGGEDSTPLLIPIEDADTLGDSNGTIIPWRHDQLRAYIEEDDELEEAWIKYMEDDHVLTIDTSSAPTTTEEAEENVERNSENLTRNNRYAENVLKNANISSEQARNWINYTGNQKEMTETLKLYREVYSLPKMRSWKSRVVL